VPYTFLARVRHEEPVPGIVNVSLDLLRDTDTVELTDGDEFVTVTMVVDPFAPKP
jgi:hypothetical protein